LYAAEHSASIERVMANGHADLSITITLRVERGTRFFGKPSRTNSRGWL
jgi:hypothetical protein